jgi:hypothetical protein
MLYLKFTVNVMGLGGGGGHRYSVEELHNTFKKLATNIGTNAIMFFHYIHIPYILNY